MKNIAIFLDGTENDREEVKEGWVKETNVYKLFKATAAGDINVPKERAGLRQAKLYISGVATRPIIEHAGEAGNEHLLQAIDELKVDGLGQISSWIPSPILLKYKAVTGAGVAERIKAAYAFICGEYADSTDCVYIFGFSRGAFIARSLAGFIAKVGLLYRKNIDEIPKAYAIYSEVDSDSALEAHLKRDLKILSDTQSLEGFGIRTHYLGVWDTVASLGLKEKITPELTPTVSYHVMELPSQIENARHAIAAHEFRRYFKPIYLRMNGNEKDSIEENWFAGCHSDVGGAYTNDVASLGQRSFHWVSYRARELGLEVNGILTSFPRSERAEFHHEKGWIYNLSGYEVRPVEAREKCFGRGIDEYLARVLCRTAFQPAGLEDEDFLSLFKQANSNLRSSFVLVEGVEYDALLSDGGYELVVSALDRKLLTDKEIDIAANFLVMIFLNSRDSLWDLCYIMKVTIIYWTYSNNWRTLRTQYGPLLAMLKCASEIIRREKSASMAGEFENYTFPIIAQIRCPVPGQVWLE